jgi:hypothetical protein
VQGPGVGRRQGGGQPARRGWPKPSITLQVLEGLALASHARSCPSVPSASRLIRNGNCAGCPSPPARVLSLSLFLSLSLSLSLALSVFLKRGSLCVLPRSATSRLRLRAEPNRAERIPGPYLSPVASNRGTFPSRSGKTMADDSWIAATRDRALRSLD